MTEAQCAERCTSAGVRCMGFIYTKMGLSDLEGQRMKLTFTIASEAVLHQCGLVTNRSCSQAMMIESHWLYYLRKGKGNR